MIPATTFEPSWAQNKRSFTPPPPPPVWVPWDRSKAILQAIDEDVLLRVLGRDLDPEQLWLAYAECLPVFILLMHALRETFAQADQTSLPEAEDVRHLITKRVQPLFGSDIDIERIVQVAQRNLRREQKTIARLQKRDQFERFLASDVGRTWVSASSGFLWGLLGLTWISTQKEDRVSTDDLFFCLTLIEAGPRDAFAFARSFELDLDDRDNSEQDEIEPGEMPNELAQFEAEEHKASEALLEALDRDG